MEKVKVEISSLWTIVQIVLIILKASGILTAPWLVILIPLWLMLCGILLVFVGMGVVTAWKKE